ncbi:MAG: prepilin peptidase, partial [Actinomycetota bacterium]|nr:prepilin peptidase [Actinomycetota bacterium]
MTVDVPEGFLVVFSALLGLIFGSFATVVAYRVPRRESVVSGRSKCPNCGHTITAIENVPLFSYLFLRGRCRNCKARISPRYPAIEVATAILFGLAAVKFDLSLELVAYAGLFWTLVVLTVIDLEERKLPDRITLPLFVVGLALLALGAVLDDRLG